MTLWFVMPALMTLRATRRLGVVLLCFVDNTHAALAEFGNDAVVADEFAAGNGGFERGGLALKVGIDRLSVRRLKTREGRRCLIEVRSGVGSRWVGEWGDVGLVEVSVWSWGSCLVGCLNRCLGGSSVITRAIVLLWFTVGGSDIGLIVIAGHGGRSIMTKVDKNLLEMR